MTKEFIYHFIKQHILAVITTCSKENRPEAALIGIAVSEDIEIIFDTVKSSRKYLNIMGNPFVAMVIGWDDETTVQYEGKATILSGQESQYLKEIYYDVYKDGRQRADTWPGLVHFKISPSWIRYSNFNEPVVIEEMADFA
ncbi:MAG TPA: pyridoxamine 5'-phosphate oxidase family protein [Puia sp.]|jgi:general stress protein 26|nr:pyridoxamine 5'-phosphate oxidase family protein [Puia sp.]